MNLVADESVDEQIVDHLRRDGHDVLYITEMAPGTSDDVILHQANQLRALLITVDKDFGELVYRQNLVHAGVFLVRLAGIPSEDKARIVADVLRERGAEMLDAFSVVARGSLRIRRYQAT